MTAADPLAGGAVASSPTSAARPEVGGSLHEDHAGDVVDTLSDLKVSSDATSKNTTGDTRKNDDPSGSAACKVVVTMGATSYTAGDTVTGTVRVECAEAVRGKVRVRGSGSHRIPLPPVRGSTAPPT